MDGVIIRKYKGGKVTTSYSENISELLVSLEKTKKEPAETLIECKVYGPQGVMKEFKTRKRSKINWDAIESPAQRKAREDKEKAEEEAKAKAEEEKKKFQGKKPKAEK